MATDTFTHDSWSIETLTTPIRTHRKDVTSSFLAYKMPLVQGRILQKKMTFFVLYG